MPDAVFNINPLRALTELRLIKIDADRLFGLHHFTAQLKYVQCRRSIPSLHYFFVRALLRMQTKSTHARQHSLSLSLCCTSCAIAPSLSMLSEEMRCNESRLHAASICMQTRTYERRTFLMLILLRAKRRCNEGAVCG